VDVLARLVAVCASWALCLSPVARAQQDRPREYFAKAEVLYDWASNSRGDKLRTFVTYPKNLSGKVPVIFFVGWLSCDSVEYAAGETDGFGALMLRLIDLSGYATVRMDKPGVGESQGTPCNKADYQSELEGYRSAFDSMNKYDFIDTQRVFVVGLSNGGGVGPLVSRDHHVAGFVAASSWGRTWYEHMLENERVRLTSDGKSAAEVNDAVKAFTQFYDFYLLQKQTPGEVIAQHPQWKSLWHDEPDGQYGRPAAFYQQLQALNLGDAWQKIDAPVLVIHGSNDTIMSRSDSAAIAEIVNSTHPGRARFVEVPGMGHGFTVNKKFHAELIALILNWMKEAPNARN
jgi:pimeloyl-ACP methyl ester carboxylesterase